MRRRWIKILVLLLMGPAFGLAGTYGAFRWGINARKPWAIRASTTVINRALPGQRIDSTSIWIDLEPRHERLEARASLTVRSLEEGRRTFTFLLNPGLRVTRATVDGQPARTSRIWCAILLRCPRAVEPNQDITIEIDYEGTMSDNALMESWMTPDEAVLPMLSCWYPIDLKSFSTFACGVTVPDGFDVVAPESATSVPAEQGRRHIAWQASRRLLGATLAAGRFRREDHVHGSTRCRAYTSSHDAPGFGRLLNLVGEAHNTLSGHYGPDGFSAISVLVTPHAARAFHGGNALLVVPANDLPSPPYGLVDIGRLVAHNWWGGTVSGRWFTPRPEAGAWLVEGLAEYSAWRTLRERRGRDAYLRFLETRRPAFRVSQPVRAIPLLQTALDETSSLNSHRLHWAQVALVIEELTGRDAFMAACRSFIDANRQSTAQYASFLQEAELAAERQLDEDLRIWFELTGTFDYAIDDVRITENQASVSLSSPGNLPATMLMDIAFVGHDRVDLRHIDPVVASKAAFTLDFPIERVILDPFFKLPDANRGDNVWPRSWWPESLTTAASGKVCIAARSEWLGQTDTLVITGRDTQSAEQIRLAAPLTRPPCGHPVAPVLPSQPIAPTSGAKQV